MLFKWNIRSFRTEILVEYPVMSTSQGTYVQIEQTPEVMRETYKCAEWGGGGLELRIAGSTIAFSFKTRCHREGCEVGSYLPSTASQKLAGSTEIWTQIAGFRVQSANHYMEPSSSKSSQVKSSHLYLYSAFNNTNCNKALHNIKIGNLSIM